MRRSVYRLAIRVGGVLLLLGLAATPPSGAAWPPSAAPHEPAAVAPASLAEEIDRALSEVHGLDRPRLLALALPPETAGRAQQMLLEATRLADRGALFAAREQFLRVMRTVCQSLDAQLGRPVHTQSLALGLRALEEADDFALTGTTAEADLNLKGYIEGHRTPVLKGCPENGLTALLAMQRYYKYAFVQLAIAGNDEPLASAALFSLGRVEAILAEKKGTAQGGGPRALALYHAAWSACPANSRAANELAVMLARRGKLTEAHQLLSHAVRTAPDTILMQNLAAVCQQMGQTSAAQHWSQQVALWQQQAGPAGTQGRAGAIQWVDQATFAQLSNNALPPQPLAQPPAPVGPAESTMPRAPFAPRMAERPGVGFWSY